MAEFTGILGEIEEIAGREAAIALSALHGGGRLYIPKNINGTDWLSKLVGREAAFAIAQRFGGDHVDMPIGVGLRARVRQLRSAGWSIYRIAKAVQRTERYVYRVLAESSTDDRQADLFT